MSITAEIKLYELDTTADDLLALAQEPKHARTIMEATTMLKDVRRRLSEIEETAIATLEHHQILEAAE